MTTRLERFTLITGDRVTVTTAWQAGLDGTGVRGGSPPPAIGLGGSCGQHHPPRHDILR